MPNGDGTWTTEERALIDRITRTAGFTPQECFYNCQWALLVGHTCGLTYCEGFIYGSVHHAWMLLNGRVWDPTRLIAPTYIGKEYLTRAVLRKIASETRKNDSGRGTGEGFWMMTPEEVRGVEKKRKRVKPRGHRVK